MTDQSDTPLPELMRYAATVLREATAHATCRHSGLGYSARESWTPHALEKAAEVWEAEDHAAAERDALVDYLARQLFALAYPYLPAVGWGAEQVHCRSWAEQLIADGWSKAGDQRG